MLSEMVEIVSDDGRTILMTPSQKESIERIAASRRGGLGTVFGYKPESDWDVSPTQNIRMITKFSVQKLYERKLAALEAITFEDVEPQIEYDPKLSKLNPKELVKLFNERKQQEMDSLRKSMSGDRSDSHRQAHDTFYTKIDDMKVHLETEKVKGETRLVMNRGRYYLKSIMIPYLSVEVETLVEGKRKVVNSGPSVRMKNIITKCLNERSVGYKTLSLKSNNFDKLVLDRKHFLPEDVSKFGALLEE